MSAFRQIVPNSEKASINERYEHFLVWLSPGGGVRQWFFSHTDGRETDRNRAKEVETITDIRTVPYENRTEVKCVTRFMDSTSFDYVKSILLSNRVFKVLKTGELIPLAIKPSKSKRPNQIKQFELEVDFMYKEKDALNV